MQRPSARLAESRHANIQVGNDDDRWNRPNENQRLLPPNEVIHDAQEHRPHNNHEGWKDATFQCRVAIEVKEQKAGEPQQAPDEYERDELQGGPFACPRREAFAIRSMIISNSISFPGNRHNPMLFIQWLSLFPWLFTGSPRFAATARTKESNDPVSC